MRGHSGQDGVTTPAASHVDARRELPAGQRPTTKWPVLHYGRIPRSCDPATWQLWVTGATASGAERILDLSELDPYPRTTVEAELHCVNGFSVVDLAWHGWAASTILDLVPPRDDVTHVLAWAEYGYSANLPISDFRRDSTLLATHVGGEPLPAERGGPLRLVVPHRFAFKGPKWLRAIEYLTEDRRGFWEERGYHNLADPWLDQRYSYQE